MWSDMSLKSAFAGQGKIWICPYFKHKILTSATIKEAWKIINNQFNKYLQVSQKRSQSFIKKQPQSIDSIEFYNEQMSKEPMKTYS